MMQVYYPTYTVLLNLILRSKMKILLKIYRETLPTKIKAKILGAIFGLMLMTIVLLPCTSDWGVSGILQRPILYIVYAANTLNFPVLLLLLIPFLRNGIWLFGALFWSYFFPFSVNVLKRKDWELGIWIGLYLATGIAVSIIFTPLMFLSCE